jgi:hypothetical protein
MLNRSGKLVKPSTGAGYTSEAEGKQFFHCVNREKVSAQRIKRGAWTVKKF